MKTIRNRTAILLATALLLLAVVGAFVPVFASSRGDNRVQEPVVAPRIAPNEAWEYAESKIDHVKTLIMNVGAAKDLGLTGPEQLDELTLGFGSQLFFFDYMAFDTATDRTKILPYVDTDRNINYWFSLEINGVPKLYLQLEYGANGYQFVGCGGICEDGATALMEMRNVLGREAESRVYVIFDGYTEIFVFNDGNVDRVLRSEDYRDNAVKTGATCVEELPNTDSFVEFAENMRKAAEESLKNGFR